MSGCVFVPGGDPAPNGWRRGFIRRPVTSAAAAGSGPTVARSPLPAPLVVLKIGGSLLSQSGWPRMLMSLVAPCPGACCLVVGGGAVVDGLRTLDRAVPQSPQLMHDLAIDAMRLTARLVAVAIGLPLAVAPPDSQGTVILDVPAWLAIGSRASALPVGWQVTSDAIAASVAVEHGGSLVLAKSVPPPPCPDDGDQLAALAQAGWLDEHFPIAAGPLATIEWASPAG
jgi:hypothetical protein